MANEKFIEELLVMGKSEEEIIKILAVSDDYINYRYKLIQEIEKDVINLIGEGSGTAFNAAIEKINEIKKEWTDLVKALKEKMEGTDKISNVEPTAPIEEEPAVVPATEPAVEENPLPAEAPIAKGK